MTGPTRRPTGDAGTSMVEVIVAMTIMTICGAIFTGAVVSLFRVNNAAQAITTSAQQTNQAYQSLDELVRSASAISTPGVASDGNWYVELSDLSSGVEVCSQLRLNKTTLTLQKRSWKASSPSTTTSSWIALASNLSSGSASTTSSDRPFILVTPAATAVRQRLTITLISQSGPPSNVRSSRSSYTLAALNSAVPQVTTSICTGVSRS